MVKKGFHIHSVYQFILKYIPVKTPINVISVRRNLFIHIVQKQLKDLYIY